MARKWIGQITGNRYIRPETNFLFIWSVCDGERLKMLTNMAADTGKQTSFLGAFPWLYHTDMHESTSMLINALSWKHLWDLKSFLSCRNADNREQVLPTQLPDEFEIRVWCRQKKCSQNEDGFYTELISQKGWMEGRSDVARKSFETTTSKTSLGSGHHKRNIFWVWFQSMHGIIDQ